jgi:GNAT superfamily N-acetyltransferase
VRCLQTVEVTRELIEPTSAQSALGRILNPAEIGHSRSREYASGEPVLELISHIQFLTQVDWQVLRAARLSALRDSPHAFTSSYAHESGWGEREWRQLLDAASWIVARDAEKLIGLAGSVGEPERPSAQHVESIWVAPTHRRRGVFRALLDAVVEIERPMGATHLLLWVLEDNHDARRAYEAVGFEPTGERQFLPGFGRFERRLTLCISRLLDSHAHSSHVTDKGDLDRQGTTTPDGVTTSR